MQLKLSIAVNNPDPQNTSFKLYCYSIISQISNNWKKLHRNAFNFIDSQFPVITTIISEFLKNNKLNLQFTSNEIVFKPILNRLLPYILSDISWAGFPLENTFKKVEIKYKYPVLTHTHSHMLNRDILSSIFADCNCFRFCLFIAEYLSYW